MHACGRYMDMFDMMIFIFSFAASAMTAQQADLALPVREPTTTY